MRRTVYFAALALALALVAGPAVADHVSEPTIPIKTLTVNVFKYPDGGTVLSACDGSESRSWDSARIEMKLGFEIPYQGANADPSEHFETLLVVSRVQTGVSGQEVLKKDWDSNWSHQNRPPHSAPLSQRWEAGPANTYGLQDHLGLWEVYVRVIGDVSGRVLEKTCRFRIVAP